MRNFMKAGLLALTALASFTSPSMAQERGSWPGRGGERGAGRTGPEATPQLQRPGPPTSPVPGRGSIDRPGGPFRGQADPNRAWHGGDWSRQRPQVPPPDAARPAITVRPDVTRPGFGNDRRWQRENDQRGADGSRWQNRWQGQRPTLNGLPGRDGPAPLPPVPGAGRPDRDWTRSDRPDWNRERDWRGDDRRQSLRPPVVPSRDWQAGRRLDNHMRWQDQRRWDSGWRQDRRYDWNSYRRYNRDIYRLPAYRPPYGWNRGYTRFSIGVFLGSGLFANDYWIDDPYAYRLPPAYGSLRWVRYYDDALLVDVRDGYVVDVIRNFFW